MSLGAAAPSRSRLLKKTCDIPWGDPLVRMVATTITTCGMVAPGDRVLVGFSGGPDSTTLLFALQRLSEKWGLTLGAAHLNHGLRGPRAGGDARHAAEAAAALRIPFRTETLAEGDYRRIQRLSPEEAARILRHRFLQRAAAEGGFNRIALGHHRDDDAECLLMRLIRGSGPLGLAGIAPRGPGIEGDIPLIRPLIRVPRSEIRAFLERHGIRVVEDESNVDRRFLRNRIRHELLPLLKRAYNPRLPEGLSRTARLMRDEEDWLTGLALEKLDALVMAADDNRLSLDRRRLAALHPALQRRVLRAAVARLKGGLRRMGFRPLEAARRFAAGGAVSGGFDLPDAMALQVRGGRLEVIRRADRGRPLPQRSLGSPYAYQVPSPGRVPIPEAGVTMVFSSLTRPPVGGVYGSGQQTAFFDMDRLRFPLVIRNFQPGDRLAPLGMQGTQKVKKVFIDRKVAREVRSRIPLLLSGSDIIWIAGLRQGRCGRVGPQTQRWLQVDMIGCLWSQND